MKKLCVLMILLSPFVSAIAQKGNLIVNMLEDAVIEYYDTLLTYDNFRLQKYSRGELHDSNIYLYLNCIDARFFMENSQKPDKIPSNIFCHTKGKYQFLKRVPTLSSSTWVACRCPNKRKKQAIEVIDISYVDLLEDTLVIHLTHCYFYKDTEWINGRCDTIFYWEISGGANWKYVFSEERKKWLCIQKSFVEI